MSFKETKAGLIPSEWKSYKLSECTFKITDGTHSTVKDNPEGKYFLLSCKNIKEGKVVLGNKERLIDLETLNRLRKRTGLQKNDILLTTVGTIGESAIIKEDVINYELQRSVAIIRPNLEIIIPEFMYYVTKDRNFKGQADGMIKGSVQKCLYLGEISNITVPCPPIEEQKAIAKILSDLDEKIEVNNKINKRLEEMAQGIFKHWFVDFEFPNEDGQPYKSSGGEMIDSELGMIPKGWEVKSIDEIVELIIDYRGKTPKKLNSDWSESGIMAISAKNIKDNKLVNLDTVKYVDNELYEKWMKDKLKRGDVLMTSEAPLGELYYLADDTKYCLSQRVYALRSDGNIMNKSVFYYMISSNNVMADIKNRSTGTTVTGIRQVELRKVKMILPCMELQNKFDKLAKEILIKKNNLYKENYKLSNLRDTLLPKLMSGEIRVPLDK